MANQPSLPGSGMLGNNMNMMLGGNNINMNINANISSQQSTGMYQTYPNMHQQQAAPNKLPDQQHNYPSSHQQQQQQQQAQGQQSQPQPQQHQQQQPPDSDPFFKYQSLLPILKESINNLIQHTIYILQNTPHSQCRQTDIQNLNKCIEDFNNINDQVYHWLALADSTVQQYLIGQKFSTLTELTTSLSIPQPNQQLNNVNDQSKDVLFYSQYLSNAKRHVAASKELKSLLTSFADDLCKDEADG